MENCAFCGFIRSLKSCSREWPRIVQFKNANGTPSKIPAPRTEPPRRKSFRFMGDGDQGFGSHYTSPPPSPADETDSLAEGIASLEVDEHSTDESADSTESVSHRPRKKAERTPEVIHGDDGENVEDGEDSEDGHADAESDQN